MTTKCHFNTFKVIFTAAPSFRFNCIKLHKRTPSKPGSKLTSEVLGVTCCWQRHACSTHLCSAASCPAASFALVILRLRAAAVAVAAGRGRRTVARAGTAAAGRLTDARGRVRDGNRTGARAHVGYRSGDGTGAAAGNRIFLEVVGKVLVLL